MATTSTGLLVPDSVNREVYDPGGSLSWLRRLEARIGYRNTRISVYDSYYRGQHKLQFATPKFQTTFGNLFAEFADNWCPLVIDAMTERLTPQGFRLGDKADSGDQDAWYLWQANAMDAQIKLGFTEAIMREEAYLLVWYDKNGKAMPGGLGKVPMITVEDPSQMIVAYSAENRRKISAAVKFFADDDGFPCATVFLPNEIYKYRCPTKDYRAEDTYQFAGLAETDAPSGGANTRRWATADAVVAEGTPGTPQAGLARTWAPREVPGEQWPLPNPLGRVPVVPITNRPRLIGAGESELQHVIPLQDAVNKFMTDMLLASEFAAFPQRWATGIDTALDAAGNPLPLPSGPGSVMRVKNNEARFGVFPETTGKAHIEAIQTVVQHIASQTRTPPHYFYLSGHFPSGDAIKSAETGLVAKVKDRQTTFGEALEEAIRLAFAVLGDPRGDIVDSETIWRDPESRTESEHVDAVVKRIALGVPQRQLQEDVGYTQAQIDRFRSMRAEEIADWLIGQSLALKGMAKLGLPGLNPGGGPGGGAAGTANGTQAGAPIGMPDPTVSGQRDLLVGSPGSPVALDVRGPRLSA